MANMNQSAKKVNGRPQVKNHEGAMAFQLRPLEELFSKVLGSFFGEKTFYENRDAGAALKELKDLIAQVPDKDIEYVLKIAEIGRKSNMISYPLNILTVAFNDDRFKGEAFADANGRNKLRVYSDAIVQRALDITEIMSSQFAVYGNRKLPMQMRKSLKGKLESFDEYKLSKGMAESRSVKLRDAILMLRPASKSKKQEAAFKSIIEGTMVLGAGKKEIRSEVSKMGQKQDKADTKDLREAILKSNLQNVLNSLIAMNRQGLLDMRKEPEIWAYVSGLLTNKDAVLKSKLLPFRFLSAYREVNDATTMDAMTRKALMEAIETSLDLSIDNTPNLDGFNAILVDMSGSMDHPVSEKSKITAKDIAMLLGAIAYKKGYADLYIFASRAGMVDGSRNSSVMDLMRNMSYNGERLGGGTDLNGALAGIADYASQNNIQYDGLVMLSDNDCYGYDQRTNCISFRGTWHSANADAQVKNLISKGIIKRMWINNLLGNSFVIANTDRNTVNLVTGFSEKFITILNIYDKMGGNGDIRPIIDQMLVELRGRK